MVVPEMDSSRMESPELESWPDHGPRIELGGRA